METATINNTGSSTTTKSKTPIKEMDKNAFLSLLVAQLKNQDPSSSQDPNAMVQQMTSFSSLEQMQNMSTALLGIQNQNSALFQAQSAGLIGKQVQVTSNTFDLKDGTSSLGINLPSTANVSIQIKDAAGKLITTLDKGSQSAGDHVITWDGKDSNGNLMANGSYTASVTAKDNSGNDVAATTSAYMRVDSVSFLDGTVRVIAGGRTFSLPEINQISA